MLIVLVATISSGPDAVVGSDAPIPNAPVPSAADQGYWTADAPPAPPLIEDHSGVWASVYYVSKTNPQPARDGLFRISHGSECELFHR